MIKIEFKEQDYLLPTKFSEIKLDKYIQIANINKDDEPSERLLEIISILSGLSVDEIKSINISSVNFMKNSLAFLFNEKQHKLVDQIKIDNKWYGLNQDIKNINFGEYIDLENFSDLSKNQNQLHYLMAILYRPIKHKHKKSKYTNFIEKYIYKRDEEYEIEEYDSESVEERAEIFKTYMSIDVVLGAMFFFIILRLVYTKILETSLTKRQVKLMIMEKMVEMNVTYQPIGD